MKKQHHMTKSSTTLSLQNLDQPRQFSPLGFSLHIHVFYKIQTSHYFVTRAHHEVIFVQYTNI